MTHPPLALGKVLLDLETDRGVDVPVEGSVSINPGGTGEPTWLLGKLWAFSAGQGIGYATQDKGLKSVLGGGRPTGGKGWSPGHL